MHNFQGGPIGRAYDLPKLKPFHHLKSAKHLMKCRTRRKVNFILKHGMLTAMPPTILLPTHVARQLTMHIWAGRGPAITKILCLSPWPVVPAQPQLPTHMAPQLTMQIWVDRGPTIKKTPCRPEFWTAWNADSHIIVMPCTSLDSCGRLPFATRDEY